MKITLDIPDGVICAFLNGVQRNAWDELSLFSHQLGTEDFVDGNIIKLPRKNEGDSE